MKEISRVEIELIIKWSENTALMKHVSLLSLPQVEDSI